MQLFFPCHINIYVIQEQDILFNICYLQNQVSPTLQRNPALGPEADGELILAIPQGEGLIRDRHRKQQLLCCTFLQQHPWEKKKKEKQTNKKQQLF